MNDVSHLFWFLIFGCRRISPLILGSTAELTIQIHQKAESDWPLSKRFPYESSVNVDYAKKKKNLSGITLFTVSLFFQTLYKLLIIISYNYLDTNAFVSCKFWMWKHFERWSRFQFAQTRWKEVFLYTYSILCYWLACLMMTGGFYACD